MAKLVTYRTASIDRLEKNCGVEIPADYRVLKDSSLFLAQHYFIDYSIEISTANAANFNLRLARCKGWNKSGECYEFYSTNTHHETNLAKYDTATRMLLYQQFN